MQKPILTRVFAGPRFFSPMFLCSRPMFLWTFLLKLHLQYIFMSNSHLALKDLWVLVITFNQ